MTITILYVQLYIEICIMCESITPTMAIFFYILEHLVVMFKIYFVPFYWNMGNGSGHNVLDAPTWEKTWFKQICGKYRHLSLHLIDIYIYSTSSFPLVYWLVSFSFPFTFLLFPTLYLQGILCKELGGGCGHVYLVLLWC